MLYYRWSVFFVTFFFSLAFSAAADNLKTLPLGTKLVVSLKYEGPYRLDTSARCVHSRKEIGEYITKAFNVGRPYMLTLVCGKRIGIDMRGWFDGDVFQKLAGIAYTRSRSVDSFSREEFMREIMKVPGTSDERISHFLVWERDGKLRSATLRDSVDPEQWAWPHYFYDEERLADIWEFAGGLCAEKGHYADAIDCWQKAAKLSVKDQKSCDYLSLLHHRVALAKRSEALRRNKKSSDVDFCDFL